MHKKILATAVLAALPVWAQAGDLSLGRVYGTVGILNGIGVGLGSQWNKDWGFRTELAT
ncbi:MAG: hypothetical protein HC848_11005, partial [Limnobacter sp.]|nr:hypothetical protein [Limnobacter sp.]